MTDDKLRHYARRKHIWINVMCTFAIVVGTTLIFLGVLHSRVNITEILTGALALIVPAMAIVGIENTAITKYLFNIKKGGKDVE